MFLSKS